FFAHERLAQQIRDYDVDGIVFHGIKSCRFVSSGMADTRNYLNKRLNVPSLYIESDLIDPRYWSDAQIKNRVDAFFESLQQRGGARGGQARRDHEGGPGMNYIGGVDVGSTQTKAVILDEDGKVVGRALLDMETSMVTIAQDAFRAALADAGIDEAQVVRIASTGYGRYNVSFGHEQVTEISCHARGAVALFPGTRTVIDIGGQDTKAIAVKPDGQVADFTMNDKCAAGTGRFLGAASYALEMSLGE